ncbi:MAG: aminotransferase class I/II-fold pyridoxal phosphate-dependent enzyme [Proteobacteria bacterium]|nr:aminotransferase class I/II-fold pyridoxal phosphate-dependent enzyme [Pseudomonadota bacterium]
MSVLPPIARRAHIPPFIAMDVMRDAKGLAREGRSIMHLEVGEPGAKTPRLVREAAMNALEQDRIAYTDALGSPELRSAIAQHYKDKYGLDVPASRVVVTTGSSGGFILTFLSTLEAGQRIGIPAPGYPAYRNILKALGVEAVEIECRAAQGHVLTAEAIEAAHAQTPLNAVLMMSPANPTGVVTPASAIRAVADTCKRLGLWLVSDEIYHGLVYADANREETALRFSEEAIIVNSFSKYFCMTGWRVGWLIVPERLVRPMECLAQNLAISVPYLSQVGATAAFRATEELEAIKAGYARNREILGNALPAMGLAPLPMDGAFYAYCDITRFSNDAMDFSRRALHEAGCAITPGLDFDPIEGHRFVRLSYAGSEATMIEGARRLKTWLR